MSLLKETVDECFEYSKDLTSAYDNYRNKVGIHKNEDQTVEDFFESRKSNMLIELWANTFDLNNYGDKVNQYSELSYHYNKMSITKYIAQPLDKIGKDKTFYFLGKRHTKVKDVNALADHFGWTWEKKDQSKADFFILGDNPTLEEARYNYDLSRPVVMDDELRVQMHFLFDEKVVNEDVDNDTVALFLNSQDYSQLKMVIAMIQFLKDNNLSPANKYRLIRSYVNTFNAITFDLGNAEHVWMSDTVQRYCEPQHRYLVTKNFLGKARVRKERWSGNTSKDLLWNISNSKESPGRVSVWQSTYCKVPGSSSYSSRRSIEFIHSCEGEAEVIESDLEANNCYSVIPKYNYSKIGDYMSVYLRTQVPNALGSLVISIPEGYFSAYFRKIQDGELELIGAGKCQGSDGMIGNDILMDEVYGDNFEEVKQELINSMETLVNDFQFSEKGVFVKVNSFESFSTIALRLDKLHTEKSLTASHLNNLKYINRSESVLKI